MIDTPAGRDGLPASSAGMTKLAPTGQCPTPTVARPVRGKQVRKGAPAATMRCGLVYDGERRGVSRHGGRVSDISSGGEHGFGDRLRNPARTWHVGLRGGCAAVRLVAVGRRDRRRRVRTYAAKSGSSDQGTPEGCRVAGRVLAARKAAVWSGCGRGGRQRIRLSLATTDGLHGTSSSSGALISAWESRSAPARTSWSSSHCGGDRQRPFGDLGHRFSGGDRRGRRQCRGAGRRSTQLRRHYLVGGGRSAGLDSRDYPAGRRDGSHSARVHPFGAPGKWVCGGCHGGGEPGCAVRGSRRGFAVRRSRKSD